MKELKSDNYIPGTQGWIITADGEAEFQNGVFRGTIKASSIEGSTITGGLIRTSTGNDRIELSNENQLRAYNEGVERIRIEPNIIKFWTPDGIYSGGIYGENEVIIFSGGVVFNDFILSENNIVAYGYIEAGTDLRFYGDVLALWEGNVYCNKLYESGCPIKIEEEEAIEGLRKIEGEEKFVPTEVSKQLKTKKYTRIKYETLPEYALMPTDKFKEKLEAQLKDDKLKKDKSKIEEKLKELPPYSINKDALLSMLIFAMQNIDKRLQKLEENYAKSK